MKTVDQVKSSLNPTLSIHGIVLTMYDSRNNLSNQVVADVRQHMGSKVYDTVIPRNVRISEAPSYGKPVLIYDIKCVGSEAYLRLATEIIQREKELKAGWRRCHPGRACASGDPRIRHCSIAATAIGRVKPGNGQQKHANRKSRDDYGTSSGAAAMADHSRLGRGLASLIGDVGDETSAPEPARKPRRAPIEHLTPNPRNPRRAFTEAELGELAESIRERGIIQPIVVREHGGPGAIRNRCR